MGGNALKNVVTRRYKRDEYFRLKEKVLKMIEGRFDRFDVPKEFPGKESFGDLDVLIVCPTNVNCQHLIKDLFSPTEIVSNGGVFSFDFEEFQIDFICVQDNEFLNSIVYLSYSDLGGQIGNICHKIGLKYGLAGLWMNVHTKEFDPTTTSTKLVLSQNPEEIFRFLGFDFEKYRRGFDDQDDFFGWIISGKYFRRDFFDEDKLNHAHRQRVSKRPIYIKFIEFLERNQIERDEDEQIEDLCRSTREKALEHFGKLDEYRRGVEQREAKKKFHEKYNGRFFIDFAETKKEIPSLMKNFERRIAANDELFQRWIIENDEQTIGREILKFKEETIRSRNVQKSNDETIS